ncbi:anti-phage deoxyguanosine triphosphatase [Azospirillum argentinense]
MSDWLSRRSGRSKHKDDARTEEDVDYGRIIHSASFRRLQGKTQILNLGDSDFYRTRLTHSLEVAQIAIGITRQLTKDNPSHPAIRYIPDRAMIQAIGSTHDLGHPPFGHGGEVALNYCMRDHGGFEGNGQTLRILARLEKFSDRHGADLTRRTLLGTLKYPVAYSDVHHPDKKPKLMDGPSTVRLIDRKESKPPKCYMNSERDIVDWILVPLGLSDRENFTSLKPPEANEHRKANHKSFDCSIMDLADDIAFGVHDLEDCLALRLITREEFENDVQEKTCAGFLSWLKERYPDAPQDNDYNRFVSMLFGNGHTRKRAVGRLVSYFVSYVFLKEFSELQEPHIRYRVDMHEDAQKFLKALKDLVHSLVVLSPAVQHLEFKGQQMVVAVFETLQSEPSKFLPRETFKAYKDAGNDPRVICDHVAGMTDSFLLRTYERLFSPRMGSVFDKL